MSQLDQFDKLQSLYEGLPNALKTGTSTIRVTPFLAVDGVSTWIVQTVRHRDGDGGTAGDIVFIERMDASGPIRLVLPRAVTDAIARQRDSLTTRARSRAARERASTRDASHLLTPAVRAKALATRRAKAAKRRAKRDA